jgi:hypothetical protein
MNVHLYVTFIHTTNDITPHSDRGHIIEIEEIEQDMAK